MGKSGKGGGFKIKEDEPELTPLRFRENKLVSDTEGVSISLKYYREDTERFSEWQAGEMKKFSSTIKKVAGLPASKLMGYKPLCEPHKTPLLISVICSPRDKLSEDLSFFELKIDPSNKARAHGVFVGSVFFLVWLDRLHAVYPE